MKKSVIALIAAASVIGVSATAIAAMGGHAGRLGMGMHGMMMSGEPMKIADVEAKVKTMFAEVDANKDGFIEQTEVSAMHEKMRTERQNEHFSGMDTNKDGTISRAEFDAAHEKRGAGREDGPKDGMRGHRMGGHGGPGGHGDPMGGNMFGRADANKDGKISLAESLAMTTEHFKAMDANSDGTLTAEERKAAHEKMRSAWKAKKDS